MFSFLPHGFGPAGLLRGFLSSAAVLVAGLALAPFTSPAQTQPRARAGDLRMPDRLRVGDPAPDFKLPSKEGDREVQLSGFRSHRPVVLIFGSFT